MEAQKDVCFDGTCSKEHINMSWYPAATQYLEFDPTLDKLYKRQALKPTQNS